MRRLSSTLCRLPAPGPWILTLHGRIAEVRRFIGQRWALTGTKLLAWDGPTPHFIIKKQRPRSGCDLLKVMLMKRMSQNLNFWTSFHLWPLRAAGVPFPPPAAALAVTMGVVKQLPWFPAPSRTPCVCELAGSIWIYQIISQSKETSHFASCPEQRHQTFLSTK